MMDNDFQRNLLPLYKHTQIKEVDTNGKCRAKKV